MANRKTGGSIVNVSSKLAVRALHGFSAHSMSKSALDQMTRSIALEMGPHNVSCKINNYLKMRRRY